jgi:hypothetical protein
MSVFNVQAVAKIEKKKYLHSLYDAGRDMRIYLGICSQIQSTIRTRVRCLLCRGKGQAYIKANKYNSLLGVERQGQCCSSKTRYSLLFPLVHSLSPLS